MVKKIIVIILLALAATLFLLDRYYRVEYGNGPFDFLYVSEKLSQEERQWLADNRNIIYGADKNSPPLRFVDPIDNQYIGLVLDYMSALSIEQGIDILMKPMLWAEAQKALERGEIQIADMFPSTERAEKYDFSAPIYFMRGVLLVSGEKERSAALDDFEGKTIAVTRGDFAAGFLRENLEGVKLIETDDIREAISLLQQGRVTAVAGDEPVVTYFQEKLKLPPGFQIMQQPLYQMDNVLAVPKGERILLSILNKGIKTLKRKDVLTKIQQKWFGISTPIVANRTKSKVMLISGIIAIVGGISLALLLLWNSSLKAEVGRRTAELLENRNDLETIFNSMTHQLVLLDADLNVISGNSAFCRFVSQRTEDICGKHFDRFGIVSEQDRKGIIKKAMSGNRARQSQFVRQGATFEIKAFPVSGDQDHAKRVLVMFNDITLEKLNEDQILQASKMAAIGQLAAGVAHEIRNPLGLIRNYAYLLKTRFDSSHSSELQTINRIESSVEKAGSVIDNMLNFSRITGNSLASVKINDFINDILQLKNKEAEQLNISFRLNCPEHLQVKINVESFKHILINLVSNAMDAMPGGGEITLTCDKSDSNFSLKIADTGEGIDENSLNSIFNPFYTTKGPGKGTGLGLYIVYNEVNKQNGRINVRSTVGQGTEFAICVPLKEEEDQHV